MDNIEILLKSWKNNSEIWGNIVVSREIPFKSGELRDFPSDISPLIRSALNTQGINRLYSCLLYTSDAADDLLCLDLVGRRIIKKKKTSSFPCSSLYAHPSYR